MSVLFVNKLTVIDFSYLHPQRGLLGESWFLDLELTGRLDEQGMVLDFGLIKRQVKGFVDQEIDHRLLIPGLHPECQVRRSGGQAEVQFCFSGNRKIRHRSPLDAICSIPSEGITTESVASAIRSRLLPQLPSNVDDLLIRLYPEHNAGAFYHYSHGLRKHDGHCRRIAHGHRSRLQILRDGLPDPVLEEAWAKRWQDIYIAHRADLEHRRQHDGQEYMGFAYATLDGDFALELPAERCYLIDTESTVENLAQHIATQLRQEHPGSQFKVRAYEGADKGALGQAG